MATEREAMERVREELTCAVCQELFKEPKTLPCLHTFCESCLTASERARQRLQPGASERPHEIHCPTCRAVAHSEAGVAAIATNFTYVNLVEHLNIRETVRTDEVLRCGKCKEGVEAPAMGFCYDCRAALCQFCYNMHERSKELGQHKYYTLEHIRQTKRMDVPPVKRVYYCPRHEGELIKLYCFRCEKVICRDCTLLDHQGHPYQFISDVIDSEKDMIRAHVAPLAAISRNVKDAAETIRAELRRFEKKRDHRVECIDASISKSIEVLEERRHTLKKEADDIFTYKAKNVRLQLEELDSMQASVSSTLDFTTTTLDKGSSVDILKYKPELMARADTLRELSKTVALEIREEDTVQFVFDDDALVTLGELREAPCAEQSRVEEEGLREAMQRNETRFVVCGHGAKGQRLQHGGGCGSVEVTCEPRTTKRLERCDGTLKDNSDGTYTAVYEAQYPGRNQVHVKFAGTPIRGSPFDVNIVRNYTAKILPEPHMFAVPDASPWGLSMVSDREIAISSSDNLVHVYNVDGTEVESIKANFTRPYGITVDAQGFMWVTDREAHNVQKFQRINNRWEKLFQFGHRGINAGQFSHPRGIAVCPASGFIYISDMKNNRVQIFRPDQPVPRYQGQFGSPGRGLGYFNLPAGICINRKGQVVVCDDHNCRLQAFDREGRFIETLGTTDSEKGLLCSPIGVNCDRHGRYIVTEFGSHCVSFLSPEGEILSCVRTLGKSYGQFIHPRGVTVDSIGYVYVADHDNMRIVRI